jgi:hypothetical protein
MVVVVGLNQVLHELVVLFEFVVSSVFLVVAFIEELYERNRLVVEEFRELLSDAACVVATVIQGVVPVASRGGLVFHFGDHVGCGVDVKAFSVILKVYLEIRLKWNGIRYFAYTQKTCFWV